MTGSPFAYPRNTNVEPIDDLDGKIEAVVNDYADNFNSRTRNELHLAIRALVKGEPTKSEPDSVRKFLDLSTAHLKLSTREAWEQGNGLGGPLRYPHPEGFGWLVWAGDAGSETDAEKMASYPEDARACIERARALGCDYIMFDCDAPHDETLPDYGDGEEPAEPEPETLVQFCDRLLGLGDQFIEDWEETAAEGPRDVAGNDERKNVAERKPEWERARKLMLDAVAFVERMAMFQDPGDDDESEMDAWANMIADAREIAGYGPGVEDDEEEEEAEIPTRGIVGIG